MSSFKNWSEFHQRLNLIFHAIVAITMLPFVWLYLEIDSGNRSGLISDSVVTVLFVIISLSLASTAYLYRKKQLSETLTRPSLRSKLEAYMKLQIVSYALLEGSALFSTIAFYLTANYLFVVIYVAVLFVFSLFRPQLDRTCRELKLNNEERNLLAERTDIPE
ncbi:MAG: hypothetical protein RIF46_08890 [Cyclobacteriaceae bacterium]